MKKLIVVISVVLIAVLFAACSESDNKGSYNGKTESFSNADEAFESMSEAVDSGDYQAALDCYQNGAADADELDLNSMYFYSLAMNEYEENGCIGYPLDILYNKPSDLYTPAKEAYDRLLAEVKNLSGCYTLDETYIYIIDGKIAVSDGGRLTGIVFCDSEIAKNDGVYSWVRRNPDGTHETKYTIEVTDTGITLTAAEDSTDTAYAGEYKTVSAEMPELCY